MEDRLRNVEKNIHNIYKILHGNGQDGLTTKVAFNTKTIEQLVKYHEFNRSIQQKARFKIFEIVFKAAVTLALAYICFRLGIKP